jgi:hypothetical protein
MRQWLQHLADYLKLCKLSLYENLKIAISFIHTYLLS